MKKILSVLLVTVMLLTSISTGLFGFAANEPDASKEDISISVTPEKSSYTWGDQIVFKVVITNNTDNDLSNIEIVSEAQKADWFSAENDGIGKLESLIAHGSSSVEIVYNANNLNPLIRVFVMPFYLIIDSLRSLFNKYTGFDAVSSVKVGAGRFNFGFDVKQVEDAPAPTFVDGTDNSVDVYSITGLEIDDSVASAVVSAPENCALLVRFIEEDVYFSESYVPGRNYINGGNTYASHVVPTGTDMETIQATIQNGTLPQYYVAEAVLIDGTGSALCNPYSNIKHTQRYAQFINKTVNDFSDEEQVLNFDPSINNNFGVLSDDVKVVSASKVTANENQYTIQNPSSALMENDKVFVSDENGNYLFRIKSVLKNGETYSVTAAAADDETYGYGLDSFYKFIKVDMDYDSTASDSVENNHAVRGNQVRANGIHVKDVYVNTGTVGTSLAFNPITFETKHFRVKGEVKGSVKGSLVIEWDVILFGKDYMKCDFTYSTDLTPTVSFKGKWGTENNEQLKKELKAAKEEKELKIGKVIIPFGVTGLDAFGEIKFLFSWSADCGIEATGHVKTTHGFKYNTKDGYQKVDQKENTWSIDAKGSVELKFGPKPAIGIEFLGGAVSAEINCFFGGKANATATIPIPQGGSYKHACKLCVDGTLSAVVTVSAVLKYNIEALHINGTPIDWKIVDYSRELFKFYCSLINDPSSMFGGKIKFDKGSCPNKEYRTNLVAKDSSNQSISVPVDINEKDSGTKKASGTSGSSVYLAPGNYIAKATIDGTSVEKVFNISSEEKTVTLTASQSNSSINGKVVTAADKTPIEGAVIEIFEGSTMIETIQSDASGQYSSSLDEGTYKAVISANDYVSATEYFTLRNGENKYLDTLLMAKDDKDKVMGGIFGTIKDAVTGQAVSDVNIIITHGWNNEPENETFIVATNKTNSSGYYNHKKHSLFGVDFGLEKGNYTLTISKEGYITTSFNVVIIGGADLEFNSTITPVGAENMYHIVLTWGSSPSDLDSHYNATYNGSNDHVYYSRKSGYASYLDVDDTSSYGPETITIPNIEQYAGYKYYSIHDYSNKSSSSSKALSNSGATVKVYKGGQLLETFYVPSNQVGTVWNVFYFDSHNSIIPVNSFTNISSPSSVTGSTH